MATVARLLLDLAGLVALATILRAVGRRLPALEGRSKLATDDETANEPGVLELESFKAIVQAAPSSQFETFLRLRPLLRDLTAERLLLRRGVILDQEPERARAVLGQATWDFLRPDRKIEKDHRKPGLDLTAIGALIDSVERV